MKYQITELEIVKSVRNEVHYAHLQAKKGHVAGVMGGTNKENKRRDRKQDRHNCREEERQ
jgi:hypothetical protein